MGRTMTEQTNSIVRDAAFYNSHPRSKALRELCLEGMVAMNRSDHASLHRLLSAFAQYGVEDNMHIGKDESYFRDPVKAVEFCASQLLKFIRAALQNYSNVSSPLEGKAIEEDGIKILAFLLALSDVLSR